MIRARDMALRLALASCVFSCHCGAPVRDPGRGASPLSAQAPAPGASSSPIGANLTRATYYAQAWPFVDLMKSTDPWISGRPEHPDPNRRWDDGAVVAMDANGWVTRLEPGQVARKFVLGGETHYHPGRYTILYRGRGRLEVLGAASDVVRGEDRISFDLAPGAGLWLELVATDPADPLREIRVIPPGGRCANDARRYCETDGACGDGARCESFVDTHRERPFHPEFLADVAHARVFRFMDWMDTNRPAENAGDERIPPVPRELSDWTTPDDASWYPVPFEVIAELANTAEADAWITIPHEASDAFVAAIARTLADRLDPSRTLYVEWSNEVWNGMFGQATYAGRQGCRRFASSPSECDADGDGVLCEPGPWNDALARCHEYGRRYHAHRTAEVMRIFERVFGASARSRLVRVVAWQVGSLMDSGAALLREDVGGEPLSRRVDVFATAPYFGVGVETMPAPDVFFARTRDEAFGAPAGTFRALATSPDGREPGPWFYIANDARVLRESDDLRHLRLVAYEGGQHLFSFVGDPGAGIRALNQDPRMRDVYLALLEHFSRETGGGLFVHYASPGAWWRHGAFGAKEWQGQPVSEAPKQAALEAFAARGRAR